MTLILKRADCVPDLVTGGQDTVGLRVPSHSVARALLQEFSRQGSGVIAAPSANRFGGVSPTRATDVLESIGDRLTQDDLILDGGACGVGLESTIVDLSDVPGAGIRLLRPGGVGRGEIEQLLGCTLSSNVADAPRVSGSLESHYAPKAKTLLVDASAVASALQALQQEHPASRVLCLCLASTLAETELFRCLRMPVDPAAYGHDLYAVLHDADRQGVEVVLIESPPQTLAWEAVNDRLKRAAASRPGSEDHVLQGS